MNMSQISMGLTVSNHNLIDPVVNDKIVYPLLTSARWMAKIAVMRDKETAIMLLHCLQAFFLNGSYAFIDLSFPGCARLRGLRVIHWQVTDRFLVG